MTHKPIQFKNISLSFPHKTCFEDFNSHVTYQSRIAIIGKNGSGKSSLLKIINSSFLPTEGEVIVPSDVCIGYVPQVILDFESLSGGERFNEALTKALVSDPNVLLLDEPTNHLDANNRKSLMRMLRSYQGTLLVVSHDVELIRNCIDTIWHIDNGKIHIFSGNYDDYMREISIKRESIEHELFALSKQKKDVHQALIKEQTRSSKSKAMGKKNIEQRKWPTIVSDAKADRASVTSGRKKAEIADKKANLSERLSELRLPEIITPKFSFSAKDVSSSRSLVSISNGSVGYGDNIVIRNVNLSIIEGERIAITGDNGSGKTTIVKAILNDGSVIKSGSWYAPSANDIGYLDQHYGTLNAKESVFSTIQDLVPTWNQGEIRRHLNDFLFRKNEEVNALIETLSGGEKARLCMAKIAAKTPKLLILDEITNNLDLETREHVIQVLAEYPGTMIVISHDENFLEAIGGNVGVQYFETIGFFKGGDHTSSVCPIIAAVVANQQQ